MAVTYQLILGPAARRVSGDLARADQQLLTEALANELAGGPNETNRYEFELRFDYDGPLVYPSKRIRVVYSAIPLSFCAYTAVYRALTADELRRLNGETARTSGIPVFYVLDILPAEAAFSRPRLVP